MNREKKFDAVHMMREIRNRLSEEFRLMTYEEQKQYIRNKTKHKITA